MHGIQKKLMTTYTSKQNGVRNKEHNSDEYGKKHDSWKTEIKIVWSMKRLLMILMKKHVTCLPQNMPHMFRSKRREIVAYFSCF